MKFLWFSTGRFLLSPRIENHLKSALYFSVSALFSIFLILAFQHETAFCAQNIKNTIKPAAFVDLNKIYSFHPMMQYYDPALSLFLKPLDVNDKLAQQKVIDKRNEEYGKLYRQISPKLFSLKAEIEHVDGQIKSVIKTKELINSEKANDPAGVADKKQVKKRILELNAEISRLKSELDKLRESYEQAASPLISIHYAGVQQSVKILKTIKKDVDAAILKVAGELGISEVFLSETSYEAPFINYTAENNNKKKIFDFDGLVKSGVVKTENIDAAFHYGPDYSLAERIISVKNEPVTESQAGPKHSQYIKNENLRRVRELLNYKAGSIIIPLYSDLIKTPLISSKTDITNAVIIEILTNSDISKKAREMIDGYLSGENR